MFPGLLHFLCFLSPTLIFLCGASKFMSFRFLLKYPLFSCPCNLWMHIVQSSSINAVVRQVCAAPVFPRNTLHRSFLLLFSPSSHMFYTPPQTKLALLSVMHMDSEGKRCMLTERKMLVQHGHGVYCINKHEHCLLLLRTDAWWTKISLCYLKRLPKTVSQNIQYIQCHIPFKSCIWNPNTLCSVIKMWLQNRLLSASNVIFSHVHLLPFLLTDLWSDYSWSKSGNS